MADFSNKWLVKADWLAAHLNAPDIVILDGNWHLPGNPKNPYDLYLQERIPGAIFFDIDKISDASDPLPHMLPTPEQFSSQMRSMGIGDGMQIIVYDATGIFSSARVWWTFRAMGYENVAVLNGGLAKWKAGGLPLEDGTPKERTPHHFTSRRNAELIRDRDEILKIIDDGSEQIVDARAANRFSGEAPEPREGLRSGHIPGSLNLPYAMLLNSDGTMKPANELKTAFEKAGVDLSRPVANTCGSGVTASILALALAILGHRRTSVYDGSWTEWGADAALPIKTGG